MARPHVWRRPLAIHSTGAPPLTPGGPALGMVARIPTFSTVFFFPETLGGCVGVTSAKGVSLVDRALGRKKGRRRVGTGLPVFSRARQPISGSGHAGSGAARVALGAPPPDGCTTLLARCGLVWCGGATWEWERWSATSAPLACAAPPHASPARSSPVAGRASSSDRPQEHAPPTPAGFAVPSFLASCFPRPRASLSLATARLHQRLPLRRHLKV